MSFLDKVKSGASQGGLAGVAETVAQGVVDVVDLSGTALDKINELLDEYKQAVGVLEGYGFTVGAFKVGTGLIPEISTSITGSITKVQDDVIKKVIADHDGQAVMVSVLGALLKAKGLYDRLGLNLGSVTLDLTISLPPNVSVSFS